MKSATVYYNILIFQFCLFGFMFAENKGHVTVNILEQDINHVLLEYLITDYELSEVNIKNEIYHKIDLLKVIYY